MTNMNNEAQVCKTSGGTLSSKLCENVASQCWPPLTLIEVTFPPFYLCTYFHSVEWSLVGEGCSETN
jgi:hypothetical protein